MKNIFFDLDGTLFDSQERLYRLYIKLTNSNLSSEQYWAFKKAMKSNQWILKNHLNWEQIKIKNFEEQWMLLIEDDEYLAIDKPFPYTKEVLKRLISIGINLFIVTNRQFQEKVIKQL